jgi:heme/copper-type cytochrome/quinol oxidase subunit 2
MPSARAIVPAAIAILVLAGLYLFFRASGDGDLPSEPRAYQLTILGERVTSGPTVLKARQGEPITIAVTTDSAGMISIHGYDQMVDVQPGQPVTLAFTADRAGRYSLDLHGADNSHAEVAALEVQPR